MSSFYSFFSLQHLHLNYYQRFEVLPPKTATCLLFSFPHHHHKFKPFSDNSVSADFLELNSLLTLLNCVIQPRKTEPKEKNDDANISSLDQSSRTLYLTSELLSHQCSFAILFKVARKWFYRDIHQLENG